MQTLTINDKCDECGKCENFLPGLLERAESGPLSINRRHPHINWGGIRCAIACCAKGALELKDGAGAVVLPAPARIKTAAKDAA